MWNLLLSFLGGPVIKGLLDAYKARIQQLDSQDQKALELLEKEVDADIAARSDATKLLIAEQGSWFTRSPRPAMGWVVVILLAKILLWDKAFGSITGGSTDPLDPHLWWVVDTVIISYFGATAVERVTRIFKR